MQKKRKRGCTFGGAKALLRARACVQGVDTRS